MSDPLFVTEIGDVRVTITEAGKKGMKLDFDLLDRNRSSRQDLGDLAEGASLEFTPIKGTIGLTAGNRASVGEMVSKLRGLADAMEQLSKKLK